MYQPYTDAISQKNGVAIVVSNFPSPEQRRFSDQTKVRDAHDIPSKDSVEGSSHSSSPHQHEEPVEEGWNPKLFPHEIENSNAVEHSKLRRSSSAPSLLIVDWTKSAVIADEDGDTLLWEFENPGDPELEAKIDYHPEPHSDLPLGHFADEVDPLCGDGGAVEHKEPTDSEAGISWSSLRKINNKLVQWSFSGSSDEPSESHMEDEFLSEFSVSLPATVKRLEPSPVQSARPAESRFLQTKSDRPPTSRNRPANKHLNVPGRNAQQETASDDSPMTQCFRGLRDSIAIARSRSHPRGMKESTSKINPHLLDRSNDTTRAVRILETARGHGTRPIEMVPRHDMCNLSMTKRKMVEPRQDSISVSSVKMETPTNESISEPGAPQ